MNFYRDCFILSMISLIPSVIMTIPGIGYINGGIILGEIGDIHRFSCPGKLLAYAGLDPVVYQSGKFRAAKTRMSKRGSRTLRFALMNTAHNVVKYNKTFHDLYGKKRAEGRNHYNALGHYADKLVRIIFKIMTDEVTFDLCSSEYIIDSFQSPICVQVFVRTPGSNFVSLSSAISYLFKVT